MTVLVRMEVGCRCMEIKSARSPAQRLGEFGRLGLPEKTTQSSQTGTRLGTKTVTRGQDVTNAPIRVVIDDVNMACPQIGRHVKRKEFPG